MSVMFKWERNFFQIVRSLDPLGEQSALNILGLSESATQQDITKRYRELARKFHPDKYNSEQDKLAAQEKFMQINEAYEKISVLHSKRKDHSSRSRGSAWLSNPSDSVLSRCVASLRAKSWCGAKINCNFHFAFRTYVVFNIFSSIFSVDQEFVYRECITTVQYSYQSSELLLPSQACAVLLYNFNH